LGLGSVKLTPDPTHCHPYLQTPKYTLHKFGSSMRKIDFEWIDSDQN
jgi:hypothetical protein